MSKPTFTPYRPAELDEEESLARARDLLSILRQRRSVRHFSRRPIPRSLVEHLVEAANTAPSGANKQPWTFVAVSNPQLKERLRKEAESVEEQNYASRFTARMRADFAELGCTSVKYHLVDAPWVIAVFGRRYEELEDGSRVKHYYVKESVGIAVGMLLSAATYSGLSTLVYTPNPMEFLNKLLERPDCERTFAVILLGYPHPDCLVPELEKKALTDVLVVDPDVVR